MIYKVKIRSAVQKCPNTLAPARSVDAVLGAGDVAGDAGVEASGHVEGPRQRLEEGPGLVVVVCI